jgi:hypothetical protein
MAIAKTLKFLKEDNGNVLLVNTQDNSVVASFNPSMSLEREKGNDNRFRIVSTTNEEGFLIDYRSVDCNFCFPIINPGTITEFLTELSSKFFFSGSNLMSEQVQSAPPPFGNFVWIARGTNHAFDHPIAGDVFQGFVSANEFSWSLIWNGIGAKDNTNLVNFNILNTISI